MIAALSTIGAVVIPAIFDIFQPTEKLPEFNIQLQNPNNVQNPIAELKIKNIGEGQAVNAIAYITHDKSIEISNNHCPEGEIISSENEKISKIQFKKLSTNFPCEIDITSQDDGLISKISISSDRIGGYHHIVSPPLNFTLYEDEKFLEKIKLEKTIETTEQTMKILEKQRENLNTTTILGIGGIIASIFGGIYSFYRSQSRDIQTKEVQFQTTAKNRDVEITEELKDLERKYSEIGNKIYNEKDHDVWLILKNRQDVLLKQMAKLSNEKDRLRSTSSAKLQTRNLIGEFFEIWVDLERIVFNMVEKINDDNSVNIPNTFSKNIQELKNGKIIDKQLIKKLNLIRRFRNSLIHGELEPTIEELEQKNEILKDLVSQMETVKIPIHYNVSIPYGTGSPGCEECDECFKPSEIVIKTNEMIVWINDDNAAHTITSVDSEGMIDRKFDSGLIMSKKTYTQKFPESGECPYFCVGHPWQKGKIIVK